MNCEEAKLAMSSASKVIGVLKKLKYLDVDKISQKEMQKQAQESVARNEKGKYHLVYKKDKRTIIAEPRRWEWEPKWLDPLLFQNELYWFKSFDESDRFKGWIFILTEGIEEAALHLPQKDCVPILDWQKIEDILEKAGYWLEISKPLNEYLKKGEMKVGCTIYRFPRLLPKGIKDNRIAYAQATTRQMAVTLALLELEKGLK